MFTVTAQDFSGLDGCGLLLVQDDGTKLLASNLDYFSPNAAAGDVMRVSYLEAGDMMSICMAEKKIVRLTCFEMVSKSDGCQEMIDPYRVDWAKDIMEQLDPNKVELLVLDDSKVYRFIGREETRIHDCDGRIVCRYKNEDPSPCEGVIKRIAETRVIYVMNE